MFCKRSYILTLAIRPSGLEDIRQLRLRPQERVFELWYRFEVQNAPSRSKLFENQIFVAARNFYGNNFRRWNIDEKCAFSLEIRWLWSVASRNFYQLFLLDFSLHWRKKNVSIRPKLEIWCTLTAKTQVEKRFASSFSKSVFQNLMPYAAIFIFTSSLRKKCLRRK